MSIGWPEVIGILFLVILLFGSTKLPEAARSVGRSMRIFKSEIKEMSEDNNPNQLPASHPAQLQQPVQQPQPMQQGQPVQQAQPVEQPVQPTTNPVNPQPPQVRHKPRRFAPWLRKTPKATCHSWSTSRSFVRAS